MNLKPPKESCSLFVVYLTGVVKLDLQFWLDFMHIFNGITPMVDNRPGVSVSTDACGLAVRDR